MLKAFVARLHQGRRTISYPEGEPTLPDRFRGRPRIDPAKCRTGCSLCADACPTGAIAIDRRGPTVDLGRCLFCPECGNACPDGAIAYSRDHRQIGRAHV